MRMRIILSPDDDGQRPEMFMDAPEGGKFYMPKSAVHMEIEFDPEDLALPERDFLNRYLAPASAVIQNMARDRGII